MAIYVYTDEPSYQEVEYIQSTGTQYIDTGYIPSNNTDVEISMGGFSSISRYCNLFGARLSFSSNGRGFHLGYENGSGGNETYFAMFGKDYTSGNMGASIFDFKDGNDHIIRMNQTGVNEDGTLKKTFASATFTSPVNFVLFAINDNGTITEYGAFKMYYLKIYDNGTLVRDFMPCYRSDGEIGLYDKVNDVFYANQGTGTFTKGPDVN